MTESVVLNKNPIRADFTADGYLILKVVMWVIELRYRFESQAEVQIQAASARRSGPPGPETARAGNGRRGRVSGPEMDILAPGHGTGLRRFRHPRVSVCGTTSPDARVAPDATRFPLDCKEKRRVVGSVGSNLSSTPALRR
jgi:hypothetical protein